MLDKYKKLFTIDGNVNTAIIRNDRLKNKDINLYNEIMNMYPLYTNIGQKLRALKNNGYCVCNHCNTIMEFPSSKNRIPYCSIKCANNNVNKINTTKKAYINGKEKREATNLKKYGATTPFNSKLVQDKIKQSIKEKYGVDNISQHKDVKNKIKQSLKDKYGVDNISQIKGIRAKAALTKLINVGHDIQGNVNTLAEVKMLYAKSLGIDCTVEEIKNIPIGNYNNPKSKKMIEMLLGKIKPDVSTVYENYTHVYPVMHMLKLPIKNMSLKQNELYQWVYKHFKDAKINDRKTIAPKELDIFIPSKNFAIEYNGVYWHDSFRGDFKQHLNKTKLCEDKNITLFHIFDYEYMERPELIKSMIKSKIGLNEKIYARKCIIKEIETKDEVTFFNQNHLSKYATSKICYGLYYNEDLIMCASFSKSRFDKKYEWELIRLASKININVIGGMSKLIKHFEKENNPNSLMSYVDRRLSNGTSYIKNGFTFIGYTKPNYWYIDKKTNIVYSRHMFRKSKLKYFTNFDENKTEYDIMYENGKYYMIHDSGNIKMIKTY